MRFSGVLRIGFLVSVVLIGALCTFAQSNEARGKDVPAAPSKGLPPRVAPSEYQAQAQAGAVTVAAEFTGHSVPTPEGTYTTEDFVVVEVGLFGSPQARATLSNGDFTLRINGKKTALPSQPYELSFKSIKDP